MALKFGVSWPATFDAANRCERRERSRTRATTVSDPGLGRASQMLPKSRETLWRV